MINSPVKQRAQGRNKDDQRTFPSSKKPPSNPVDPKQKAKLDEDPTRKDRKSELFASKSPNKKSVQIQQILKAIGVVTEESSKSMQANKKPTTEYLN